MSSRVRASRALRLGPFTDALRRTRFPVLAQAQLLHLHPDMAPTTAKSNPGLAAISPRSPERLLGANLRTTTHAVAPRCTCNTVNECPLDRTSQPSERTHGRDRAPDSRLSGWSPRLLRPRQCTGGQTSQRGRVRSNKHIFWTDIESVVDRSNSLVIYQHYSRPPGRSRCLCSAPTRRTRSASSRSFRLRSAGTARRLLGCSARG